MVNDKQLHQSWASRLFTYRRYGRSCYDCSVISGIIYKDEYDLERQLQGVVPGYLAPGRNTTSFIVISSVPLSFLWHQDAFEVRGVSFYRKHLSHRTSEFFAHL